MPKPSRVACSASAISLTISCPSTRTLSARPAFKFPGVESAVRGEAQVDAIVQGQVLRRSRRLASGKIGGRSDGGHAHVRTDPHRNHILRNGLAEPHARVEPLLDDVDKSRVHADFDLDVRVDWQQLAHRWTY